LSENRVSCCSLYFGHCEHATGLRITDLGLYGSTTDISHLVVRFFQAADGIRGRDVTGVQTCALPI